MSSPYHIESPGCQNNEAQVAVTHDDDWIKMLDRVLCEILRWFAD